MSAEPESGRASGAGQSRPSGRVLVAQVAEPLRRFLATEAGSAGVMLVAVAVALVWANSPWSETYESLWHSEAAVRIAGAELAMDLEHWVSEGLMALFFLVIGLEVRRELSMGELTERRLIVVPLLGALAGMAVPALLYLAIAPSGEAANGWGVVIATDTAFVLAALAIVGPACPTQLRLFVLSVAVFDDAVAVAIIGLVFSESLDLAALAVAGASLGVVALLARRGEWRYSIYAVVLVVLWVATVNSGLHASIAGMLAGLLIVPTRPDAPTSIASPSCLVGGGTRCSAKSILTASSALAASTACFHPSAIRASLEARKRVPTLTPLAPRASPAARPRPSVMPPAATPVMGRRHRRPAGRVPSSRPRR